MSHNVEQPLDADQEDTVEQLKKKIAIREQIYIEKLSKLEAEIKSYHAELDAMQETLDDKDRKLFETTDQKKVISYLQIVIVQAAAN